MNEHQRKVLEFHKAFRLTVKNRPVLPYIKDAELRKHLIFEEAAEFARATDIVGIADALADLLYVVYGAAITYGIDMEPVFREVHRSNMSKAWKDLDEVAAHAVPDECELLANPDGTYIVRRKSDGKVIKSPTYSPADVKGVIGSLRKSRKHKGRA